MAKVSFRKSVISLAMIAAMMIGGASACFAATGNSGTTEAYLTVPATPTDFTITERIDMTGTANSVDLQVEDLTITNNAKLGKLNIDSIKATAQPTWTIVNNETDFARKAKNTNEFSIVADGTHDLTAAWNTVGTLDPAVADADGKNAKTVKFTGKTGIRTTNLDATKVADIVTTVSIA